VPPVVPITSRCPGAKHIAASKSTVRARVGLAQPTAQSVSIRDGEATVHFELDGEDRAGDGTVPRDAAALAGVRPDYVPQRHSRLARTSDAFEFVRAVLTERTLGPPMGEGVGVGLPDVVEVGAAFEVSIQVPPGVPVGCAVVDPQSGRQVAAAQPVPRAGHQVVRLRLATPGLFRVDITAGGSAAVGDLVLALATDPSAARP
jgi:hypothetical protein